MRRKWIKFIQFKRADFLAAPHHAHLCSEHFSECDFANPMEYRMSKLTRCSGTLSKSCLTSSNWYGCILVGLSGKVSVSSSELKLAILQRLPRVNVVGIWSRDLGVMATPSVRQKMPFFSCIYNHSFTYIIVPSFAVTLPSLQVSLQVRLQISQSLSLEVFHSCN